MNPWISSSIITSRRRFSDSVTLFVKFSNFFRQLATMHCGQLPEFLHFNSSAWNCKRDHDTLSLSKGCATKRSMTDSIKNYLPLQRLFTTLIVTFVIQSANFFVDDFALSTTFNKSSKAPEFNDENCSSCLPLDDFLIYHTNFS